MRQPCVILVPVRDHIDRRCEGGLRELERQGYQVRRAYGQAAIDVARCQLATDALADGFEELMWIDADIGFDPMDVLRMRAQELPLVCGLYSRKSHGGFACIFLPETSEVRFGLRGGLTEVLYCGFGFVHTRRAVYEAIRERYQLPECNRRFAKSLHPYFMPLIVPDAKGGWYLAEDFAFCERARRSGFKMLADTSIRLWHYGTHGYSWEEAGGQPSQLQDFTMRLEAKPKRDNGQSSESAH